jgi:hypothetical protein
MHRALVSNQRRFPRPGIESAPSCSVFVEGLRYRPFFFCNVRYKKNDEYGFFGVRQLRNVFLVVLIVFFFLFMFVAFATTANLIVMKAKYISRCLNLGLRLSSPCPCLRQADHETLTICLGEQGLLPKSHSTRWARPAYIPRGSLGEQDLLMYLPVACGEGEHDSLRFSNL